jgi:hypothetical protein
MSDKIFVFGSNERGAHGAGSAKAAMLLHGAVYGCGVGRMGNSYAIPTKDKNIQSLPLERIQQYVTQFIAYANENPDLNFEIVKIGCGLAGFTEDEIFPMFRFAPDNCILPDGWRCDVC